MSKAFQILGQVTEGLKWTAEEAFWYALDNCSGRFRGGEPVILTSPEFAAKYARLKIGRWKEAEASIRKDEFEWNMYMDFLIDLD